MTDAIRGKEADEFPMIFTASQWQELEHQTLAFKYILSGIPIPPHLISTLIDFPSSILSPHHQPSLPIGWGCFQVGGYGRKIDPEPGRCRRTDGKKWRCSKEANPNSKYCEKHMNRGKSKSKKKQIQTLINPITTTTTVSTTEQTNTIPAAISCSVSPSSLPHHYQYQASSFSPFLSPRSGSRQSSQYSTMEAQNQPSSPSWLLDTEVYEHQPSKTIRFEF